MIVYVIPVRYPYGIYYVVRDTIKEAIDRAKEPDAIGKIFAVELPDDAHEVPIIPVGKAEEVKGE